MKKLILSLVVVAFAFSATAQETTKNRWAGHTTNKFWHNWEISAGAGVSLSTRSWSSDPGHIGLTWNAGLTKWIVPIVGIRAQVSGDQYRHYENKVTSGAVKGDRYSWPSLFGHVDLMINLSNWIGGYREDRVYYAVPYVGFGYNAMSYYNDAKDGHVFPEAADYERGAAKGYTMSSSFAVGYGLQNKFRVCKQIDINLDLFSMIYPQQKMPAQVNLSRHGLGYGCAFGYGATLGISYRFNKRNWDKAYTEADFKKYVDEAAALRDALAAANAARAAAEEAAAKAKTDADRAAARAAAAEAEAAEAAARAAAAAKGVFAAGNSVFFNIGASKLSSTDKVRLSLIADQIKNSDAVYTINGYADKKTGTATVNQKVSESRAKNVYNYLVSCGVSKDQLKYAAYGDTVQPYGEGANYKANRAAIIEK